jgi:hypothetical protein
VGDALVLCDAGGGTVDLISYEITSLQPFHLTELTNATGRFLPCDVDASTDSLRRPSRVSHAEQAVRGLGQKHSGRACLPRLTMKTFDENIKPGFRSRDDEEQYVTFPKVGLKDDPTRGLKSDTITVTG